jgi:hypothetical protein
MNLDLGAKLVWILIIGALECWKKVFLKKYLKGNYESCMYGQLENKKGSHILEYPEGYNHDYAIQN